MSGYLLRKKDCEHFCNRSDRGTLLASRGGTNRHLRATTSGTERRKSVLRLYTGLIRDSCSRHTAFYRSLDIGLLTDLDVAEDSECVGGGGSHTWHQEPEQRPAGGTFGVL